MPRWIVVVLAVLALAVLPLGLTVAQTATPGPMTNEFGTPCAAQPASPLASPAASPLASPRATPSASPLASPSVGMATPGHIMGGCATATATPGNG